MLAGVRGAPRCCGEEASEENVRPLFFFRGMWCFVVFFWCVCGDVGGARGGGGLFLFLDEFNCVMSGCVQCDCHDFFLKRNF